MNDQGGELQARVRTVLTEAGFEEIATGAEGVHLIAARARRQTVGWLREEVTLTVRRRGPRRSRRPASTDLAGLRHAFGLAMAAALRGSGLVVESRRDGWLLVLDEAGKGSSTASGPVA
ncbi:hypothetical protein [Streptomyces xanthophaeus]